MERSQILADKFNNDELVVSLRTAIKVFAGSKLARDLVRVIDRLESLQGVDLYNQELENEVSDLYRQIAELKSAKQVNSESRWVSISDELPKNGQKVWVRWKQGCVYQVEPAVFQSGYWVGCFWTKPVEVVPHWMPIPRASEE